jgi:hypothetical protein
MVTLGGKMRNDRKLKRDANSDSNGNAHGPKMVHQWSGRGVFSGGTHATVMRQLSENIVLDESTQFSLVMSSTWWTGWIAPSTSGKKERQMDKTWQNMTKLSVWICMTMTLVPVMLHDKTVSSRSGYSKPQSTNTCRCNLTVNAHLLHHSRPLKGIYISALEPI